MEESLSASLQDVPFDRALSLILSAVGRESRRLEDRSYEVLPRPKAPLATSQSPADWGRDLLLHVRNCDFKAARQLLAQHPRALSHRESGVNALHVAASQGLTEMTGLLLETGADPNELDDEGRSPAWLAAYNSHPYTLRRLIDAGGRFPLQNVRGENLLFRTPDLEIIDLLLLRGASLQQRDADGCTLTHCGLAHSYSVTETIDSRLLIYLSGILDRGAPLDARGTRGLTPLHVAASTTGAFATARPIVRLLVERGADVDAEDDSGMRPLHFVAALRPELVAYLLEHGAQHDALDHQGKSPLHYAAGSPSPDACRLLLDKGAEVDREDGDGSTPTFIACVAGHSETLRLLESRGGHLYLPGTETRRYARGITHLHIAASSEKLELARLLLERGADPNATTDYGTTPLSSALNNKEQEVVSLLLDRGALVNPGGPSPLAQALDRSGNKAIVRLLLERGADPNGRDSRGFAGLDYAAGSNNLEAARLLLARGARVDPPEQIGDWRPLHQAAQQLDLEMVKLLLSHGASTRARNQEGKTPADLARAHGSKVSEEVVRVLEAAP